MSDRLPPRDILAALLVVLLWGLNFVAVKVALGTMPPFLMTALRFAAVGLMLAPFFRPRRDQLGGIFLLAVVLGIGHFGLLFLGMSGTDAASTAVAIQLGAPFSVLLAWMLFKDVPGWRRGLGMALAFGGVVLLAGEPSRTDWTPLLIIAVSALSWAAANLVIKRLEGTDPLVINGWMAVFAGPMLLVLSLLLEDGQIEAIARSGWTEWGAVAYTSIGSSVVAYTLWYRLLARHPVSKVVPFTLLGPAIGFAAGVFVLGEEATAFKLAGGIFTVAGVAVIELGPGRRLAAAETEPGA